MRGTKPLGLGSYSSAVGIGARPDAVRHGGGGPARRVEGASPPILSSNATRYASGRSQWQDGGYGLTHGPGGYGFYGLPLPWGKTPEMDYFLKANLHGGGLPGGGSPAPDVSASPTSAAFGVVAIGQASAARTIVVSNAGSATATNMTYPAAPAKFTKSGTCSGTTLSAGASCTVVFTYTPDRGDDRQRDLHHHRRWQHDAGFCSRARAPGSGGGSVVRLARARCPSATCR